MYTKNIGNIQCQKVRAILEDRCMYTKNIGNIQSTWAIDKAVAQVYVH